MLADIEVLVYTRAAGGTGTDVGYKGTLLYHYIVIIILLSKLMQQ